MMDEPRATRGHNYRPAISKPGYAMSCHVMPCKAMQCHAHATLVGRWRDKIDYISTGSQAGFTTPEPSTSALSPPPGQACFTREEAPRSRVSMIAWQPHRRLVLAAAIDGAMSLHDG
jgi:hypothetical protein